MTKRGAKFGHITSDETKKKISLALIGRPRSEEAKYSTSRTLRGHSVSSETRRKISESNKRRIERGWKQNFSKETRHKISLIGRSDEVQSKRRKTRELHGGYGESKCHFWKGGISREPYSFDFDRKLRSRIKDRDSHKCRLCDVLEKDVCYLEIHHIDYNKKNSNESNLITLCPSCHPKTNGNRSYWIVKLGGLIMEDTNVQLVS